HREVSVDVLNIRAVGKARADERTLEPTLLAHADAVILEMRALAARGREELLPHGVVDDRVLEPTANLAGDGHRKRGKTVQEIRRAIERIDDPHRVAFAGLAALLGEKRVLRVELSDLRDDLVFGGPVDLGDEIVAALRGDLQAFQAIHAPDD